MRRKQTSREKAKEDENLVKRISIERIATERNELGQQENLQKFQDGRAVYAVHHTANEFVESPGGDSHMKQTGMLVVSLRGVNFGFWSHLGCSGQSANILCRQGLVSGFREETQNYAKRNRSQIFFLTFLFTALPL